MGLASLYLALLFTHTHTQIARETGGNEVTLQLHYVFFKLVRIRVTAALRYTVIVANYLRNITKNGGAVMAVMLL